MVAASAIEYSVITPSRGDRPRALAHALESAHEAARRAGDPTRVECLVAYDGVRGGRVRTFPEGPDVRYFDLPPDGDFGNALRAALIRAARGRRLLFVDDDNALTPEAFLIHDRHHDAEMVVGRVDVSRAHDIPWLPRPPRHGVEGVARVRPGDIDPLCLCVTKDLVMRCRGWTRDGGYESDFHNILRYARRARPLVFVEDVVGVYDAGLGLDETGRNLRQQRLPRYGREDAEPTPE